jgi:hypothetical protein
LANGNLSANKLISRGATQTGDLWIGQNNQQKQGSEDANLSTRFESISKRSGVLEHQPISAETRPAAFRLMVEVE